MASSAINCAICAICTTRCVGVGTCGLCAVYSNCSMHNTQLQADLYHWHVGLPAVSTSVPLAAGKDSRCAHAQGHRAGMPGCWERGALPWACLLGWAPYVKYPKGSARGYERTDGQGGTGRGAYACAVGWAHAGIAWLLLSLLDCDWIVRLALFPLRRHEAEGCAKGRGFNAEASFKG